jgi:hypothetical protein
MSNDRLTVSQILLLMVYAAGMSGGQVLFKMAALRYVAEGGVGERLLGLVCNIYFVTALVCHELTELFTSEWLLLIAEIPG